MFDAYIRAVEEKGKLIFPEDFCYTHEDGKDLDKKALDEIESELGPFLYAGNYYNNPVADDLVEFKDEWFRKFRFEDIVKELKTAKCILSIDPATKAKQENDFSGLIVSKIVSNGEVYILEATPKKLLPNKLIDEVFRLVSVYNPDVVAIEGVSAQILWVDLFEQEMKRRKVFFNLESYDQGTTITKPAKIRKLIPYYARGQIFHADGLGELEKQLREFPRNANDDLIDALQAQIPYWHGTTVVQKDKVTKYTKEWWDQLRKENIHVKEKPLEKLFEEYRPARKATIRQPQW